MHTRNVLALSATFVACSMTAVACSGGGGSSTEGTARTESDELSQIQQLPHKRICDGPDEIGYARCHARVRTDTSGAIKIFASPSGLTPADLASAYKLPSTGSTATIAIVDAQDDPNAESDLGVYRSQFGLPACTTANGCFKKVNENGKASPLPTADSGWGGEISLDLDMASAICPTCKILLVEANSASMTDLGTAVNTAASLGASVVSNSYGGPEDSSITSTESYFNHPGVFITVSSGDNGYGVQYPASSAYVTGVGGTSLVKSTSSSRGWTEGAWSGAGSGCSKYVAKPSWQKDTACTKKTVADVSAVADPNTGVAVYDTYGGASAGAAGWEVYGGTSAASPIVAAVFALTNQGGDNASFEYAHTSDFFDVTSGNNGSCSGSYLCTAGTGYDGPTGLGTPNGTAINGGGGGGGGTDAGTGGGGGTDAGTGGGTDAGGGGGGGTCSHPICSTGTKLTSSCDPCATKICASDSYCCGTQWDNICVGEVSSICGESCGGGGGGGGGTDAGTGGGGGTDAGTGGGGGTCSHPICSSGSKLTSTCDPCATKVCGQDPYCCKTLWDNICVGEVGSICGETCN